MYAECNENIGDHICIKPYRYMQNNSFLVGIRGTLHMPLVITKYHITSFYYDFLFYIMCAYVYSYVGIDLYSIQ